MPTTCASRPSSRAQRRGRDEQVLIGLNCRDLETLEIDFERFERLRDRAAAGVAGRRRKRRDRRPRMRRASPRSGYRLALVGTSLMRSADPGRRRARTAAAAAAREAATR